jgi:rhomboid family GlyGly-CTERM serine protease
MKSFRPVLLLVVGPAVLLQLAPATHGALLYDRTALLHGEWWRLWTGHWVHFSVSHLAWNLAVLLAAGAWLEHLQPGRLLRYLLVAAPVLSGIFLIGEPAMQVYGGLSGLATGVVVLLALGQFVRDGRNRAWWGAALALLALKLGFDATHATPLFSRFGTTAVRSSALAHAGGAVTAVVAVFLSRPAGFRFPLSQTARPVSPPPAAAR